MAAHLLKIGRFASVKYLRVESFGALVSRSAAAASFCTEAEKPAKPAKKTKAAAKKAAEPEEPFDNNTYRNLQHHTYNPYTFADLDVEMAKFRLPQPSSVRPSS
uniref:NADH dehydrogenase [ubiquinone] flavoprotein 3, mitochondrial n=1 Tax=Gouania willdenowi TaxID=441366 RepID=A0A8C5I669_GOUWI